MAVLRIGGNDVAVRVWEYGTTTMGASDVAVHVTG